MNLATAAGKTVEMVNGIPAPLAVALTIIGCVLALGWVVYIVMKDNAKDKAGAKKKA
jgi:hypothetical protein